MFFAGSSGVDVSHLVDSQRGNFFFGRAVENEAFSSRRNSVDQAASVRTGDQIASGIEPHYADMRFIAFEKDGMLAFRRDAENFSVIPGGYE